MTMDDDEYRTDQVGVPKFWVNKFETEAPKNWDAFYKRNQTNFYRDRHWTTDERTDGFPCLAERHEPAAILVEVGCGVANSVWPLLEVNDTLRIHAFDFSRTAINLIRSRNDYDPQKVNAFVWDFCRMPLSSVDDGERNGLAENTADYATMIFVLSAVPPQLQPTGLANIASILKPGGRLLFRDYAAGDLAQTRFKSRSRITENYFVRQDRTLSYFFDEARLRTLMSQAGFEEIHIRRVPRRIENRKEGIVMERVFLQAEFRKRAT